MILGDNYLISSKDVLPQGWNCWPKSCKFRLCPFSKIQFFSTWSPTSSLGIADASAFFHANERKLPLHCINGLFFPHTKDFLTNRKNKKRCWHKSWRCWYCVHQSCKNKEASEAEKPKEASMQKQNSISSSKTDVPSKRLRLNKDWKAPKLAYLFFDPH